MIFLRTCAFVCALQFALPALTTTAYQAAAQPARAMPRAAPQSATLGIFNWVHTTGDAEAAFDFYHDVFGIELAPHSFIPDARPPEGIRAAAEAGSDELVWNLTDTRGARFRTVFMQATNTPFGLELSEFFDIPRDARPANPWDPGASMLRFEVRDLDAVLTRLMRAGAPIVTRGGRPLETPAGRSILVRDPDGYLIAVIQASAARIAGAAPGEVVGTSIGITVANMAESLSFYRGLLGFAVGDAREATRADLRLHGLSEGRLTQTAAIIPGTEATVWLSQFQLPNGSNEHANPFEWRIQDVGAPQFQLEVDDLDSLLDRTRQGGYRFLSVGEQPIDRPFGRFVFVIDADGVLVEYVERAAD